MKLVKTCFFLLLLIASACSPFRYLPENKEVSSTYVDTFKELKKEYKQNLQNAKDWDIVLDPIEQVPTAKFSARGLDISNWGEETLLPGSLRQRIRTECKYPVVIRILDTGAKWDHPALQKGQITGKNYSGDGTDIDINGHSTHVAGIVFGQGFGLAWDLADMELLEVAPVEVLQDQGWGSFMSVARAIEDYQKEDFQLIKSGVSVIYNGSLGGGREVIEAVETAMKNSTREGVYFVFASGNNGRYVEYPGLSDYTLATAALTRSLKRAHFSGKGPQVFGAMPGVSINSTYRDGQYAELSGTSMATPFYSSATAIALSKWGREKLPNYTTIKKYLEWVSTDIPPSGKDDDTGAGIAYISSILDKDPANMEPDEPDEPDEPIEPIDPEPIERPTAVDYTFEIDRDYTIIWEAEGIGQQHTMIVDNLRFTVKNTKQPFEKIYRQIEENCASFFENRGMVLLPHHDQYDAAYWTIRFLYMLRFDKLGMNIETHFIKGSDEEKGNIVIRDDLMETMFEMVPQKMEYIDIENGSIRTVRKDSKRVMKTVPQDVKTYTIEKE